MNSHLRVLSIGAGAIGTYIGGSLVLDEQDVVFVERPQVVEELQSRGMRLNIQGKEHHIQTPRVVASIEKALNLGDFDVALFALKSFDTSTFLESITPLAAKIPPILCLSNGIDNEPAIARVLGAEKVIAGTVTSAIGRRAAGDIVLERLRGVGVAGGHQLSEHLVSVLGSAGLNARFFDSAAAMKWSKMLTNLIANASAAILDMSPSEAFAHPGLYRLEILQLREALAVMRAQGIGVVDLPGTPVRLLAFAVRLLPLGISRPLLQKAVGGGRGGKMPSFHIDLHSGRGKSEVEYLNGAVVREGKRLGIQTPVNQVLTETLLQLTRGEIPLEAFGHKPGKLLENINLALQVLA
jgi:2-dehydropantoate 2-reductase